MSHIVLESTRHPLMKNEIAVDLLSMLYGFNKFKKEAGHECGYLSYNHLDYSYNLIKENQIGSIWMDTICNKIKRKIIKFLDT